MRLALLSEGENKESRILSIKKWDGSAWKIEFSTETVNSGDRLAVGKFTSDKPAEIITAGELFYWDGKTYARKKAPKQLAILGTVVLKDGTEKLLLREGGSMKVHTVKPDSDNWLGAGSDPPPIAYMTFIDIKGPAEDMKAVGMPEQLAAGGAIGVWDTKKANLLLLYGIQIDEIQEEKPNAKNAADYIVKGHVAHITVADPRVPVFKALWHSATMNVTVLDVTINDPRSGTKGIAV